MDEHMSNLFRKHLWRWLSILSVVIALLTPVGTRAASDLAADYPQRAVRLIVPFSAAGGSDTVARLVARKLSEAWSQPVVVENNAAFAEIVSIRGHLDSPRLSVLAVTGERRLQALPDTPTFTELGYSDFEPNGWYALFMRSGTPEAIVHRVSARTLEILDSAEMLAHLRQIGLEPAALPPVEFEQIMRRDAEIWRRVAKSANITTQ